MIDLDDIRAGLARRRATQLPDVPDAHRAAVAAVLRERDHHAEVVLIRRTEMLGDPWSGHMAFPGGRHEPGDADLLATAMRETHEEVGLDLAAQASLLGQLDDLQAMARGQLVDLVITPFVFVVRGAVELRPNEEVDEILWAALEPMASGSADTVRPYEFRGQTLELPAYRVGPHIVWGLTYRMLQSLFARVEPDRG